MESWRGRISTVDLLAVTSCFWYRNIISKLCLVLFTASRESYTKKIISKLCLELYIASVESWRGRISTVYLLVLTSCFSYRNNYFQALLGVVWANSGSLLKEKDQYRWPPCTDQAAFHTEKIISKLCSELYRQTGNPHWRERISTLDLLVLTSWDQLLFIQKLYIYVLQNTLFKWGGQLYWVFPLASFNAIIDNSYNWTLSYLV